MLSYYYCLLLGRRRAAGSGRRQAQSRGGGRVGRAAVWTVRAGHHQSGVAPPGMSVNVSAVDVIVMSYCL